MEKYFEDLLEGIFKTKGYDYLSNIYLSSNLTDFKCEVDFFVFAGNKFYYIEVKIKLSKYYIDDFLKRASEIIDKLYPMINKGISVEFILIGGYSDDNVKEFQYFIDSEVRVNNGDYNSEREGLNSIPYYFTVPIPDKKDNKITCIAEPEYKKLSKLMLEICPK